jgi:hypothetical protein
MWLEKGDVRMIGDMNDVAAAYGSEHMHTARA